MRICVAIDAAKVTHRAVAVDEPDAVNRLVGGIRALGQELAIGLVVVGAFAHFLEAVLQAEGIALVHTPGIAVNCAGPRFSAGERKSDPRDDGARIRSLPCMGAGLVTEFVACVGDIRRFGSTDALASAAGLAPVQRPSGKRSGWRRAYGGDKALKRFCYQNSFGAVTTADPLSPGFHDRKRRKGKH